MECIVLAGGLGTRLRSSIGDTPKCMAPVNGQPFLSYLFRYLERQGFTKVVLSLGFQSHVIISWITSMDLLFEIDFVVEEQPLGTGGAIQLALNVCEEENVFVINGDTFFDIDTTQLLAFHQQKKGATTIALRTMENYDRYGTVIANSDGLILSFEEKKHTISGNINGGIYIINREKFSDKVLPEKFSFEKNYLEAFVHEQHFYGLADKGYFIDIGIPEDYSKAQEDFKKMFR